MPKRRKADATLSSIESIDFGAQKLALSQGFNPTRINHANGDTALVHVQCERFLVAASGLGKNCSPTAIGSCYTYRSTIRETHPCPISQRAAAMQQI